MEQVAVRPADDTPRRKPSVTISEPPAPVRFIPVPAAPEPSHSRSKTHIDPVTGDTTILLPSVPTHEPEDADYGARGAASGSLWSHSTGQARSTSSRHLDLNAASEYTPRSLNGVSSQTLLHRGSSLPGSSGELQAHAQRETEEVEMLEELADDTATDDPFREDGDSVMQSELPGLIMATQAASSVALQVTLRRIRTSVQDCLTFDCTARSSDCHQAQLRLLEGSLECIDRLPEHQSSASGRALQLEKLNQLLDLLSSEALAVGSSSTASDSVNVATAIGDLLLSLEKVRPSTSIDDRESTKAQAPSSSAAQPNHLPSWQTHPSSEARERYIASDPSAVDSSALLHLQYLTKELLMRRASMQQNQRVLSSQTTNSALSIEGSSSAKKSLDRLTPRNQRTSRASRRSSFASQSSSSASWQAFADASQKPDGNLNLDAKSWSHIDHILVLLRDLIASQGKPQPTAMYSTPTMLESSSMRSGDLSSMDSVVDFAEALAMGSPHTRGRSSFSSAPGRRHSMISSSDSAVMAAVRTAVDRRGSLCSATGDSIAGRSISQPPSYNEHERHLLDLRSSQGSLPLLHTKDRDEAFSEANTQSRPMPLRGILRDSSSKCSSLYDEKGNNPWAGRTSEGSSVDLHQDLQSARKQGRSFIQDQRLEKLPQDKARKPMSAAADVQLESLIDKLAGSGRRLDDQRIRAPTPIKSSVASQQTADPMTEGKGASAPSPAKTGMLKKFPRVSLAGSLKLGTKSIDSYSKSKSRMSANSASDATTSSPSLWLWTRSRQRDEDAAQLEPSPTAQKLAMTPRSIDGEDIALFDLLTSGSAKSRFADQEAVMRPTRRRANTLDGVVGVAGRPAHNPTTASATEMVQTSSAGTMPASAGTRVPGASASDKNDADFPEGTNALLVSSRRPQNVAANA